MSEPTPPELPLDPDAVARRRLALVVLLLFILATVAFFGSVAAYRGYKSWRQEKLVKRAGEFLANGEVRNASLCLQGALKYNSRHIEANRLMADLTEASRSSSTLLWRGRVVELNPESLTDRLALVRSAMLMRDPVTATNALNGVRAGHRNSAAYHNVAGSLAHWLHQPAEAEQHFLEADRLEPGNPMLQLSLAALRLSLTNSTNLDQARACLQQMSRTATNAALRCQALRELAADALRHRLPEAALAISQELVQQTGAVFADRLQHLQILRDTTNAAFTSALDRVKQEATNEPVKIFELALWHVPQLGPGNTLAWLKSLSMTYQTNQPVALLIAQCYTALKDWPGLQSTLQTQSWADLEFLRHAFLSRCLREGGLASDAKDEWSQALRSSGYSKVNLVMLFRLVASWKWQEEAEETLWAIVDRYPAEKWAALSLSDAFMATGRTRLLMTLFAKVAKNAPADLYARNNLAFTALLLDAKEVNPHKMARDVYQKAPTNSVFVSTYAHSLVLQDKPKEAVQLFEGLGPKELQQPSIAAYYGLALHAAGEPAKAKPYLELADKARLLPEERELLRQARTGK